MTNTLSHSIRHGIALTMHGPYNSPFTITQTGTIFPSYNNDHDHAAVFSSLTGAAAPTLVNQGLIWDNNSFPSAVRFTGGGTVLNYGAIRTNDGYAINIGYGLVSNAGPTGYITGYFAGVKISGSGTILNEGTIYGRYYGITLGTGAITNAEGGLISAYYNAIRTGDDSTITNEGNSRIFGGLNAIQMGADAAITNTGSASIETDGTGIQMGAYGHITNADGGYIEGGGFGGVEMGADGVIINTAGATIANHRNNAIAMGTSGSITNAGIILGEIQMAAYAALTNAHGATIENRDGEAIQIGANSTITNAAGATIFGVAGGIVASGPATIINAGLIYADDRYGFGIKLAAGGTITNDGFISSVEIYGGTLVNEGTIYGDIRLEGSTANRLVMDAGAVFDGDVITSESASNILELGAGSGTLARSAYGGFPFYGFQTIEFDSGAAWQVDAGIGALSNATILGFTAKDTIDIGGLFRTAITDLTLNAHGVLEIPESGTQTLAITFATANTGATFQLTPDRGAGAALTIEPTGTPSGAVTLSPATPRITFATNIDTFGVIGTYGIATKHGFTATPIGAALFAAPGTDFTATTTGLIESQASAAADAAIVIESASTFTNAGTVIGATGIEVLGVVTGAYIDSSNILRATLGAGIYLQPSGSALNTGRLTAATTGMLLAGGGYAYNSGKIHAGDDGIALAGGALYNYGAIDARTAILVTGTAGYAFNAGGLRAKRDGIDFDTSGNVINTGTIRAGAAGLVMTGFGTVKNAGFISAANGILLAHGGTLIDSGTIIGATYAASFAADPEDRLVLDPGAALSGAVDGGGGTLELARANKTGTFDLGGGQFSDFATIEIDPGATWDFAGTFSALGLTNNGTIIESPADLASFAGPITGTGTIKLSQKPLTIENTIAASQHIAFTGTNETLALTAPQNFAASIANFALTDTIDLTGISLSAISGMHFGNAGLTLTASSGILAFYFADPAGFGQDVFTLTAAGAGTAITLERPAPGLIDTPKPATPPPLITLQF